MAELNPSTLEHDKDHPSTYTLMLLDSSLIPAPARVDEADVKIAALKSIRDFINPKFLKPSLKPSKDFQITCMQGNVGVHNYHMVKLQKVLKKSAGERLTDMIFNPLTPDPADQTFVFIGSMLVFPKEYEGKQYGLVYLIALGGQELVNRDAIFKDWGLRLAASTALLNVESVKELSAKIYRHANPSTTSERKAIPTAIEEFDLSVGSTGIKKVRMMPNYGGRSLVTGRDSYKFSLRQRNKVAVAQPAENNTLKALEKMAFHLFDVYFGRGFSIHPSALRYIDEEIKKDKEESIAKIANLNKHLNENFNEFVQTGYLFADDSIWKRFYKDICFEYEEENYTCIDHLLKVEGLQLEDTVNIIKGESSFEERISRLIFTLPIEYESMFYRFECGRWYEIHETRLEAIRKLINGHIVPAKDLFLPSYIDEANIEDEGEKDYKELRFNKAAVRFMQNKKKTAYLLDLINVALGTGGNVFEFADIFLKHNGQIEIMHVKRAAVKELDHHREQVVRCARFLGENLNRQNAVHIFFESVIKSLHDDKKLRAKTRAHPEGISFSTEFYDKFRDNIKEDGVAFLKYLTDIILKKKDPPARSSRGQDGEVVNFNTFVDQFLTILNEASIDWDFFVPHTKLLGEVLDAIYDGVIHKKINLTKAKDCKYVQELLRSAKRAIQVGEAFGEGNGLLPWSMRKKINLVLVIVNDFRSPYKFTEQSLWGLEDTMKTVEQLGFNFKIAIVNEEGTPTAAPKKKTKRATTKSKETSDEDEDLMGAAGAGAGAPPSHSTASRVGTALTGSRTSNRTALRAGSTSASEVSVLSSATSGTLSDSSQVLSGKKRSMIRPPASDIIKAARVGEEKTRLEQIRDNTEGRYAARAGAGAGAGASISMGEEPVAFLSNNSTKRGRSSAAIPASQHNQNRKHYRPTTEGAEPVGDSEENNSGASREDSEEE